MKKQQVLSGENDNNVILHYNGTVWSRMESNTDQGLSSVWGASPTDVFAVGDNGEIVHYDGVLWSHMEELVCDGCPTLIAVWGTSGNNVYAVGTRGTIVHYDGIQWSFLQLENGLDSYNGAFHSIWGSSASDIYVGGERGALLHYNGVEWRKADFNSSKCETVWEKNLPVSMADNASLSELLPPLLQEEGKYVLKGALQNSFAQIAAQSSYSFYVDDSSILLTFETDKNVYKPSETVTVSGEITNRLNEPTPPQYIVFNLDGVSVYEELSGITVPANGSYPFVFSFEAPPETSALTSALGSRHYAIPIVVGQPSLEIKSEPEVAGRQPFDYRLRLTNTGITDLNLTTMFDGMACEVMLAPGETKTCTWQYSITEDTEIFVWIEGDYYGSFSSIVRFGEAAELQLAPEPVYPEGTIVIPYTINNIGELNSQFDIAFTLNGNETRKSIFVAAGQGVQDNLVYDLEEGDYTLTWSADFGQGSSSFRVAKSNRVSLSFASAQSVMAGYVDVTVTAVNTGYNEIQGALQVRSELFDNQTALVLEIGETKTFTSTISLKNSAPGIYPVDVSAFIGGTVISRTAGEIEVPSLRFEITGLPENIVYVPGQEAALTFKVKNTGMIEGRAEVHCAVMDLLDETRSFWLAPDQEGELTFRFILPDDLSAGNQHADIRINGTLTRVPFYVNGLKIIVTARLDKQLYAVGDTAILTLDIVNESQLHPDMTARVIAGEYEGIQDFTLGEHATIELPVPITATTPRKLTYGVYLASGRAIHLNAFFMNFMGDIITLYTDKPVYNQGETVTVNILTAQSGELQVTAPGYQTTKSITGNTSFSFKLPDEMNSGAYRIAYEFNGIYYSYYFDVRGYSASMLEFWFDKALYAPVDTMNIEMIIKSMNAVTCMLKGRVYEPDGSYKELFEAPCTLTVGENRLVIPDVQLVVGQEGIHRLVCSLLKQDTLLDIMQDEEFFEVARVGIVSVATDKEEYGEPETVHASIKTFACTPYSDTVKLFLNGSEVVSRDIDLNGENEINIDLSPLPAGAYRLVAQLGSGDTLSEKNTEFVVRSIIAPKQPTGLIAFCRVGRVILLWNDNPESDIAGYNVYRLDGNQWIKLNSELLSDAGFDESEMLNGRYCYRVTAVNSAGNESLSAEVCCTVDVGRPPVANAGADQLGRVGDVITLDADGSSDPDGDTIVGWQWEFVQPLPDGSAVQLTTPDARTTTFTIDKKGEYSISLKVYDGTQWSTADEVVLTVVNRCPVAEAGANRLGVVGAAMLVDGSGSYDLDGDPITYIWRLVSKPERSMSQLLGETERVCSITPDRRGDYIFELVVNDGACDSVTDRVIVSTENRPPIARAGEDKLGHVGDTITLDGSAFSDPDNDTITALQWELTKPAGSTAQLTTPDAITTAFTIDRRGEYLITLKVFDGLAWSEADEVIVSTENSCPVAVAGDNQTAHTGQAVMLNGRGSRDPDNDTITYHWALNAPQGSTTAQLDNASSATPAFMPDINGRHVAVLIVNDGICDSPAARVTVTVVNECPVADAGDDQSAKTGQTVTLDGSGSFDPDNDSITYMWVLTSPQGSTAGLDNDSAGQPTFTPDKPGTYTATLVVSDGVCSSVADSVLIIVDDDTPEIPNCDDLLVPEPPCAMKTDYGPGGVGSDYVKVYSYADYQNYEASNYGYKNGKYKKLKIAGSITMPDGDLVMHSPAVIEIGKNIKLKAPSGAICIDGRMGIKTELVYLEAEQVALMSQSGDVSLGKFSQANADGLYVSAGGSGNFEDHVFANVDGPVTLLSTGPGSTGGVAVKQAVAVMSSSLVMRSMGTVQVSEFADLEIAGPLRMVSTGAGIGSQVWVKYGAVVQAESVCISGPEDVSVGPGSIISAREVSVVSTGSKSSSKAAIKPATLVKAVDMTLSGSKAWLEPFSLLLIRSTFTMNAASVGGCSVKGCYRAGSTVGNCLE